MVSGMFVIIRMCVEEALGSALSLTLLSISPVGESRLNYEGKLVLIYTRI